MFRLLVFPAEDLTFRFVDKIVYEAMETIPFILSTVFPILPILSVLELIRLYFLHSQAH
ncbi:hypothetical protein D3C85_1430430 [compost metagenome]